MRKQIVIVLSLIVLLGVVGVSYAQGSSQPVASFDFESEPDINLFEFYGGNIENGKLTFSLPTEEDFGEFYINPSLSNYAVEMDYNVISGDSLIYISLHNNELEDSTFCLFEFTFAPFDGYVAASNTTYSAEEGCIDWVFINDNAFEPTVANQTVRLRAEVVNNTYKLFVDGIEVISSEGTTYGDGGTYIWVLGETEATFDNVVLYDLDANPSTTTTNNLTLGQSNSEPTISFDFESEPDINLFEFYGGNIENGKLTFSLPTEEEIGEFYINPSFSNYAVEMDYNVISGEGLLYIFMHYDGALCRFEFAYVPLDGYADAITYNTEDGCQEWIYITEDTFEPGVANQTVRLRAEVVNNMYRLLVDGTEIISSDDATYSDGGTGVQIFGATEVTFDNIVIYDLDADLSITSPDNAAQAELDNTNTSADSATESPGGGLFGNPPASDDSATEVPSGGLFGNTDSSNDNPTEAPSGSLFGNTDTSGDSPTEAPGGGLFGNND